MELSKNTKGLNSEEAASGLAQYGPNQIFKPTNVNFWEIAKHEVTEPMILLLLVVGFFYSIWGKFEDAITIFIVIFLLVLAEVYNEYRAKKAIASLEKIAAPKTKVLRDGKITEVDSENIVPGDVLILTQGTKIAADARVLFGVGVSVDESALTGESFPQNKDIGDEIYAGCVIVSGEGKAEVTLTGGRTKLGKIASTLKEVKPPKTALQLAMKSLAGKLVYLAVFFSVLIPVIGILRGGDPKTMILTGLSLSFATIPEELPIVITMVLGLGSYTLSKNKFLVKKIKAAEILGNATVIVTDKTGTITENKMKIVSLFPNNEKEIMEKALGAVTDFSVSPIDKEILANAEKLKIGANTGEVVGQRNFDDGRKTKSVIRKTGKGYTLFASGAPEEIFGMCRKPDESLIKKLEEETSKGRRVIAIAYKEISSLDEKIDFSKLEKDLNPAGIISFEDPPRAGVTETIAKAAKAGIRTIMVTGDHPETAKFIAHSVGIASQKILTGKDLEKMTDKDLSKAVAEVSVFARATPEDKCRIVKALQDEGEVVAVTGDGINDALALKSADIGIAMGMRGTDVAKEAAEVVLADDNYVTIAQGIFEGRKFFDNLQKGIKYYLSVKMALVLIFLLPTIIGIPMPFAPIQIIVLELFMDLAASAGFVGEPAEKDIYTRPPRNPKDGVLGGKAVSDIIVKGLILFATVTATYLLALSKNLPMVQSQTLAFSAWIFAHIALAFVSRSDHESIFSQGPFSNKVINVWAILAIVFLALGIYLPAAGNQFNLTAIGLPAILAVAGFSMLTAGFVEIKKRILPD